MKIMESLKGRNFLTLKDFRRRRSRIFWIWRQI